MKKINSVSKFVKQLLAASLIILTTFSVAEAQRGARGSFGGGGRSFGRGGRISAAPRGGFGGGFSRGPRVSAGPRGGFSGGNRIAVGPRFAPGRFYGGGLRAGVSIGRSRFGISGYYHRPYYGIGYGAYYRSYYPHIGFHLNVLPFGYYPFYYGGYPYYYNDGLFYQHYNDGYQVVAPPIGAEINRLPRNAQEIVINGQQYFEKDGVYYQQGVNEKGNKVYRVAGKDGVLNTDENAQPQDDQQYDNSNTYNNNTYNNNTDNGSVGFPRVGDVVNTIPAESRAVTINGEKLFVSPDGVYYQEDNSGNSRIFKVVGVPTSDDTSDASVNPQQ